MKLAPVSAYGTKGTYAGDPAGRQAPFHYSHSWRKRDVTPTMPFKAWERQ